MKSLKKYRFRDNPEEQRFFEKFVEDCYGDVHNKIRHIVKGSTPPHITEEEIHSFLAAIQWLGSSVGQHFLKETMGYEKHNNE